ncbi:MAG: pyruvate kinase, partial [Bacteroidota bacterium]
TMSIKKVEKEIFKIYEEIKQRETIANHLADEVHPDYRISAKNLYHYLVLRSFDLRKLHDELSDLGISSIRTAEGYVLPKIQNVLKLLHLLQGKEWTPPNELNAFNYKASKKRLSKHASQLLNKGRQKNVTEIMVTMPDEAAEDIELVRKLVAEGMEIARINLGRGNLALWKNMIVNIKQVKRETKHPIKIYMDLAGPKIRTAKIEVLSKKGKVKKAIPLKVGDHLILTKRNTKGKKAKYGDQGKLVAPAEVGVQLPQIINDLEIGQSVFFDDGTIEAIVINKKDTDAELVINKSFKRKLGSDKGINLPSTNLNLPSLTSYDLDLLPFVVKHANIVGYSFVRNAKDVALLHEELSKIPKAENLGIVYKIETLEAFDNLPLILLEAMKRANFGVMIARGDLAVEIGFERISEVQNQILWFCEAAHIPVIWATQVLETLAKTGMATRAEISDAAISTQAECVMLNKGPYILEAVRKLKNILIKMETHTSKKKSSLRALNVAKNVLEKIHHPVGG